MSELTHIDRALLVRLYSKVETSPRKRANYNFHKPKDTCQRFLNAIKYGSYMRPHRHTDDETFIILRGEASLLVFNDQGAITDVNRLCTLLGFYGVHVPAGLWHTLVVTGGHAVLMEIKPGPYDPKTAKELAPWAPEEGSVAQDEYLQSLFEKTSR